MSNGKRMTPEERDAIDGFISTGIARAGGCKPGKRAAYERMIAHAFEAAYEDGALDLSKQMERARRFAALSRVPQPDKPRSALLYAQEGKA